MTFGTIDRVKSLYDNAHITKCCESGCSVKVDNIRPCVILKGEKLAYIIHGNSEKACDCIVFTGSTSIVIIMVELKSRLTTTKGILEKFENSANIICQILKKLEIKDYKISAVLASKSFPHHPSLYHGLLRKIKIENTKQAVRKIKCGEYLSDFL